MSRFGNISDDYWTSDLPEVASNSSLSGRDWARRASSRRSTLRWASGKNPHFTGPLCLAGRSGFPV